MGMRSRGGGRPFLNNNGTRAGWNHWTSDPKDYALDTSLLTPTDAQHIWERKKENRFYYRAYNIFCKTNTTTSYYHKLIEFSVWYFTVAKNFIHDSKFHSLKNFMHMCITYEVTQNPLANANVIQEGFFV